MWKEVFLEVFLWVAIPLFVLLTIRLVWILVDDYLQDKHKRATLKGEELENYIQKRTEERELMEKQSERAIIWHLTWWNRWIWGGKRSPGHYGAPNL